MPVDSYRTNRIIGGVVPSVYLEKLEKGKTDGKGQVIDPPIDKAALVSYLATHCIPVSKLYDNDFEGFIASRQKMLLDLVTRTTGQLIPVDTEALEEGEEIPSAIAHDSGLDVADDD